MNKKVFLILLGVIGVILVISMFFLSVDFRKNNVDGFPRTEDEAVNFVERMVEFEKKTETNKYQTDELIKMYNRQNDKAKKIAIVRKIEEVSPKTDVVSNLRKIYRIERSNSEQKNQRKVSLMLPYVFTPLLKKDYPGTVQFAKEELKQIIAKENKSLKIDDQVSGIFFASIVMNSKEKDGRVDLLKSLSTIQDPVLSFFGMVGFNYFQNEPPETIQGKYNRREKSRINRYFPRFYIYLEEEVKEYYEKSLRILNK